jgi:hypothetical protein
LSQFYSEFKTGALESQEIICIKIDLGVDVQRYQGFRENQRLFIGRDSIEKNRGYL